MAFRSPLPWWQESFKFVSLVRLGEKRVGLRFVNASGARMTMPLGQVTFKMLGRS